MISVVVCSINPALASQLESNIASTIGVPYEIIIIDNNIEKQSINYIYNKGAVRAGFDIICFLHEDIIINTLDWGKKLLNIFELQSRVGLIGIAGAKYKSKTNSGWYTNIKEVDCCMITHLDPSGKETKVYLNPEPAAVLQEVVVIDGVFMCTRRSVWNEMKFDDDLLKGFHFYDIDYSFRVSRKYLSVVTYDIDIIHLTTGGDFGDNWMRHAELWHTKYSGMLPFSCIGHSNATETKYELAVARTWLNLLMKQKVSFKKRIQWISDLKLGKALKSPIDVAKFMIYDVYKLFDARNPRSKSAK